MSRPPVDAGEPERSPTAHSGGRAILRRVVTYSPASLVPAALTLATSMVFTRIFDARVYGLFSLALATATILQTSLSNWLKLSIAKFLPPEHGPAGQERVKRTIVLGAGLMVGSQGLISVVLLFVAALIWPAEQQALAGPALVWVMISSVFDVLSTVLSAEHRAKDYVRYQLIANIATFALRLGLVFTLFQGNISVMFWSLIIAQGALLPLLWIRTALPSPLALLGFARSAEIRRSAKAFIAFGLPMTLWLVASLLMDVGDRFVIDAILGSAAVGVYDANYRLIVGMVALMIVPISLTLYPYLMSITGKGMDEHVGAVLGVVIDNLLLLGVLAVGMTYLFQHELALLLGPGFREGSRIMPIVLAGVFAFNIGSFVHKPYEIAGRTATMVTFAYLAAGLNIALNFALIPIVGYIGAAYATLLAYVFYSVVVGALGRRVISWHISVKPTLVHVGVVIGCVAGIALIRAVLADHRLGSLVFAACAAAALCAWVLTVIRRSVLSVPRF